MVDELNTSIFYVQLFQMYISKLATRFGKNTCIGGEGALLWEIVSWDKGGWEVPQSESENWTFKKVFV